MADLSIHFAGIKSPNPFWVASGPASNTEKQAHRAFEAGWGGVVWKTIGEPVVNVSSRYSALDLRGSNMAGFNNIELISDRSPQVNFREIKAVKERWPHHAMIASLMTDTRENWHDMIQQAEDSGADGIELNFGCPHGMCERGMGSAVGQHPDVIETLVGWVMEKAQIPVIVKLTPNITNIVLAAQAARRAGANAISLINTISSITQVNLDTFCPEPCVDGFSTHGGYCGPAVKPIALHMVQSCAADPDVHLPVSGIGGIGNWRDAAEFIALGAGSVQVCTAIMHYGFRIVEDMTEGLNLYLESKGLPSVQHLQGKALPAVQEWQDLNLNFHQVASIDLEKCIGCNLCYIACEDGAHQAIDLVPADPHEGGKKQNGRRIPKINEPACVGCNLCSLVCPVDDCIRMVEVKKTPAKMSWADYQDQLRAGKMDPIPPRP